MSRTLVVLGSTGTQGGGVINEFLKDGSWNIRAITRNPDGEKVKAIASQGVDVVTANSDDLDSLVKAFTGAFAIYAVTNFWGNIMAHGPQGASEIEYKQGVKLATAASKTTTLKHYIWTTLPSAKAMTVGKHIVPHIYKKAEVDIYIKEELPDLAKKTAFLWHGFYSSNLAFFPTMKPTPFATAGKCLILAPRASSTILPVTGDTGTNTGMFVRQILARPSVSHEHYAKVCTEYLTIAQLLALWSKVVKKPNMFVKCTVTEYEGLFPVFGMEIAAQLLWNEEMPNWKSGMKGFLTAEDLGIKGLVSAEDTFIALKPLME